MFVLSAFASSFLIAAARGADLTVPTANGEVRGTINATSPHVRQFLGVPFGEPPVDKLRFQPPVKYASVNEGGIDAKAFAPSCMQPLTTPESDAKDVFHVYMPQLLPGSPAQSEDCLYLNVYAPLEPTAPKLPVFVWIAGGGFASNGANVPYQYPDPWVERTQGHVVVTINYRLNLFGYPNAAAQSSNVGLLDQRLAHISVEWVRDNIAAFGGDADRIVLWGQSAGAWSVNYFGYAYPEDPIIKGLIADSGGSTVFAAGDDEHRGFSAVAKNAGCGDLDAAAEMACMQSIDAKKLQKVFANTTGFMFGPVVDNITVFADPKDRAQKGLVAKLPAILGVNSREGSSFAPWTAEGGVKEEDMIAGSKVIVCPTIDEIRDRFEAGLTTYRYLYSGNFSNITPASWLGATHSSELPLIFGTHHQYNHNSTDFEWNVSHAMQDLWLSFATHPEAAPSTDSFSWPKYDPAADTVASFASTDGVVVTLGGHGIDDICT
ncbi:Alpha/Beta hydrolase protein [Apiospora marii]|uniref:Alpha/Beta hydrolase protein n=1 Tax=Apiospora marii TaxID=335849 RepID=UPI00312F09C5